MTEKKHERVKTPISLMPTTTLVNASLEGFRKRIARERETRESEGRGLTSIQIRLNEALSGLRYDPLESTASDVQSRLKPFVEENLAYGLDSPFKRFVADLEYIGLLEKGGLEAVNERVAELFEQAKKSDTSTEKQIELLGKLNDFLMRGIYVFPHLAKGVEVKLKPGVEERTGDFEKEFGHLDYYLRAPERLSNAYQREYGKPLPQTLTFPLPYGFTTGTHGSGERAAVGASQEQVYFTLIHPRDDWQTKVPALALALEAPLITFRHTHFTLDEIETIQFTDKGDFVPYVDNRHGEEVLIERPNYVNYYLVFRDFSSYRAFRKERIRGFSDDEWKQCQEHLLEPERFSNLWREDFEKRLEKGFLAVSDRNPDEVRLYEITNVKLPSRDSFEAAAPLFYFRILRETWGKPQASFAGNEVIQRLVEIPVEERYF